VPRGNIEKRGENRYRIRIYLGTGPDGKQLYHREAVRGTRKQAEKRLTELLRELDTGGYVEPNKLTLGEYLEEWLNTKIRGRKRPTTVATYEQAIRRIKDHLGDVPIQKLTPLQVDKFYGWALHEGGKGGRPLSPATVNQLHRVLHKALEDAVGYGIVARNVCDSDVIDVPASRTRTKRVWTRDEAQRFLDYAQNHRLYALFVLALTTGMRRGELLGLRWSAVNLDACEITINHTVTTADGKVIVQDHAKTEESEAVITISPAVADILRRHKIRQAKERLAMGDRYTPTNYVFTNLDGTIIRPDTLTKMFPKLCDKAGVPRINLHGTRHTYITDLLNRQLPAQVVQRRARHSSWQTTVQMYGHVIREVEERVAQATDDLLPSPDRDENQKAL